MVDQSYNLLLNMLFNFVFFWDRILLCSPGWLQTCDRSYCLHLPSPGIIDLCHHGQVLNMFSFSIYLLDFIYLFNFLAIIKFNIFVLSLLYLLTCIHEYTPNSPHPVLPSYSLILLKRKHRT
jgi:hypothetical protein